MDIDSEEKLVYSYPVPGNPYIYYLHPLNMNKKFVNLYLSAYSEVSIYTFHMNADELACLPDRHVVKPISSKHRLQVLRGAKWDSPPNGNG